MIKAEKALKEKQAKLPDPLQHGAIDLKAAEHILGDSVLKAELLSAA